MAALINGLPNSSPIRCRRCASLLATGMRNIVLPLCVSENPISKWLSARRRTIASICKNSVRSVRKKRLRPGVLKKSSRTAMRLPAGIAHGFGSRLGAADKSTDGPRCDSSTIQPMALSAWRLCSVMCDIEAMLASASPLNPRERI